MTRQTDFPGTQMHQKPRRPYLPPDTQRYDVLSARFPVILLALTLVTVSVIAQSVRDSSIRTSPLLSTPPRTWAVEASNNEVAIIERRGTYLRYQMHIVDEKGNQLRDVIESSDGTVARLLRRDGRPLTHDEDEAEQQRLSDLLASRAAYQKHEASDAAGKKRAVEMIHMLPDAMIFAYTPGQPKVDSFPGEQIVLDFKPNPDWHPPTLAAEALTGLEGRVWIDRNTRQMVRMEGDIFRSVSLGYGMLARIYPGGRLSLEQMPTPYNRWVFSHFVEQISLRALMVKTIHQNAEVRTSAFQPVSPMSYQEAIRVLLSTPLPQ